MKESTFVGFCLLFIDLIVHLPSEKAGSHFRSSFLCSSVFSLVLSDDNLLLASPSPCPVVLRPHPSIFPPLPSPFTANALSVFTSPAASTPTIVWDSRGARASGPERPYLRVGCAKLRGEPGAQSRHHLQTARGQSQANVAGGKGTAGALTSAANAARRIDPR